MKKIVPMIHTLWLRPMSTRDLYLNETDTSKKSPSSYITTLRIYLPCSQALPPYLLLYNTPTDICITYSTPKRCVVGLDLRGEGL